MAQAKHAKSGFISLKLTTKEAAFLERLLGNHITGKDEGPRGISSGIWKVLDRVLDHPNSPPFDVDLKEAGKLYLEVSVADES